MQTRQQNKKTASHKKMFCSICRFRLLQRKELLTLFVNMNDFRIVKFGCCSGAAVVVDGVDVVAVVVDVIVVIVSDFVRQQQSLCLLFMVN